MRKFLTVATLLATVLLAGCVSKQSAKNGALRILNAVPDGPFVALYVNNNLVVQALDYPVGSAYVPLGAGTYDLIVQGIKPGDTTTTCKTIPLPANCTRIPNQTLAVNDEFTYVLIGKVADDSQEQLLIKTRTTAVPAGQARLQFVHTSSGTGLVDIYVTAPDAVLTGLSPTVAALGYRDVTDQQVLAAGTAQIRVTEAGNPANVLFDSGSLSLAREADLLYAVVAYQGSGSGAHPLALSVLSGVSAGVIVDHNVASSLRIVHAAAATGPVNVTLDDGGANTGVPTIPPGLAFGSVDPSPTLYRDLPAALYTVKYLDNADTTKALLTSALTAVAGTARTLVLAGTSTVLQQLTLGDSLRRVATEARVRLVYASPVAGAVDIYVQAHGTDIATVTPNLTAAVLGSDTGYLVFLAGDYDITLTATGSKTDIKLQKTLTVANGGAYEAIVTDTAGGVAPLTVIPLDDFPAGP